MTVVLARVDDRLIHGQVTVGWSRHLEPDEILLCNDEIAADPWQSRVYASSVPPQVSVAVLGRRETAERLIAGRTDSQSDRRTILLTSSPRDMLDLLRSGVRLDEVNVGGMHFAKGKVEFLEYVWLDAGDLSDLRGLLAEGARLGARAVPGGREVEMDAEALDLIGGRL